MTIPRRKQLLYLTGVLIVTRSGALQAMRKLRELDMTAEFVVLMCR